MEDIKETRDLKHPIQVFKFNLDDLEKKQFSQQDLLPSTLNISNYISLKSEFLTVGLKSLYDFFNALDDSSSIEALKIQCAALLLTDLEKHANLPEFYRGDKTPKFELKFYKEINKLENLKLDKLQDIKLDTLIGFVAYCASSKVIGTPQSISAKMLLKLYEENATIDSVKESLQDALNEYKKKNQQQVEKDIGGIVERGRDAILLKDQFGETKLIDMGELRALSFLTGEQKDFIKTSWHQGTFGSGWFAISCFTQNLLKQISLAYHNGEVAHMGHMRFMSNNFLVVDISTPSEVKLYNQCNMQVRNNSSDLTSLIDFATGVLEVDISHLKREEFIPGCTSGQPKINVYISTFDPKLSLEFPKDIVVKSLEFDHKRKELTAASIKSCIHEIEINGQHRDKAVNLLVTLQGEEAAADLIFCLIVTSALSAEEKQKLLNAISITLDKKEFFNDSPLTVAAELMAKAKSPEVLNNTRKESELSIQYNKFIEFIRFQQANPLEGISVKISQVQKSQEEHIVQQCEGLEQTLAVKNYVALEPNQEKQEKFANKQLKKYFQGQDIPILDHTATHRISNALISILTPLCKNDQEKNTLKNSADSLIRKCALCGTIEMSFEQKWHAYIIDPIKKLLGRTQEMPKFLKEHPELTDILTAHMRPNKRVTDPVGNGEHASNLAISHKIVYKEKSRRG